MQIMGWGDTALDCFCFGLLIKSATFLYNYSSFGACEYLWLHLKKERKKESKNRSILVENILLTFPLPILTLTPFLISV